ncbi:transposase [Streptomyces sp. NPDC006326]|uniref:transposase n=1 Tax=Streptomyces sp. NPDC006326 TaxID=3156752 RepID=UPI0033A61BF0
MSLTPRPASDPPGHPHRPLPAADHPPRHRRSPGAELVRLYHERWEIETVYAELKSTILGGHVLRARTPGWDRAGEVGPADRLPSAADRESGYP